MTYLNYLFAVALFFIPSVLTSNPTITITPESALVDEELNLEIKQLHPLEEISLEATSKDQHGVKWSSKQYFIADSKGNLKIFNPLSLIYSMEPHNDSVGLFTPPFSSLEIQLKVYNKKGSLICKNTFQRKLFNDDIEQQFIDNGDIKAWLCMPKEIKSSIVVVSLSGSNGGYSGTRARLLASKGIPSLALAYFGKKGLPKTLKEIPLEYFKKAFDFLKSNPSTSSLPIIVIGESRGGELALLLGSYFPKDVKGVVAYVPSNFVWGGIPQHQSSAWTYNNEPLPCILPSQKSAGKALSKKQQFKAISPLSIAIESINNTPEEKQLAATIPIENFKGPLLLISGKDDQMWPSSSSCQLITEELSIKGFDVEHLDYEGTGHNITFPGMPTTTKTFWHPFAKSWFILGGNAKDSYEASKDSWEKILEFLNKKDFTLIEKRL
jgi:dienelactone hydrolase